MDDGDVPFYRGLGKRTYRNASKYSFFTYLRGLNTSIFVDPRFADKSPAAKDMLRMYLKMKQY